MIETLEGLRGFVARGNGLVVKIEKDDWRVSMDENERAMLVLCASLKKCDFSCVSELG